MVKKKKDLRFLILPSYIRISLSKREIHMSDVCHLVYDCSITEVIDSCSDSQGLNYAGVSYLQVRCPLVSDAWLYVIRATDRSLPTCEGCVLTETKIFFLKLTEKITKHN